MFKLYKKKRNYISEASVLNRVSLHHVEIFGNYMLRLLGAKNNVPHQVTKHTHEQIYMKHIESNMIITMRRRIDEIKHTLREK